MNSVTGNQFLDSLSQPVRSQILGSATQIVLPLRTLLEAQEAPPAFAYFLTNGMASVVVELVEGGTAEVALIGAEGLTSSLALLGPSFPSTRCFMQIAGAGYKVAIPRLQHLFLASEEFRRRVLCFVQQQSLTTSQLAACGQLHEILPRLARWLLMVNDRIGGEGADVTHEFLAQMLAVQRPTVSVALKALQLAGLIDIHRGACTILNRDELVKAACDCYPITARLLSALNEEDVEAAAAR